MKWFRLGQKVIGLLSLIVASVEREGDGPAKKVEAIKAFKDMITLIDASMWDAPDWLVSLLTSEAIVSFMIDQLVRIANNTGVFTSDA